MLSVANVRSPSAAASYFASDNYYASADADRSGQWVGEGAKRLGLDGKVEAQAFDALLRGELPDGSSVGNPGQVHRPGTDLTFSVPKSWSLLALVGNDERIIAAYREAVLEALHWAEKNAAETRMVEKGKIVTQATGNLAIGLFQHDTNRNQEPNLHFHAVIANVTQGKDGKWRTLKNDRLWQLNTTLNAIAMARFRVTVEKLGYEPGPTLKHGNFEARGITREQVMAFSSRRQEVLDARRGPGLEAGRIAALDTRASKDGIEDRETLGKLWSDTAKSIGLDLSPLVERARTRTLKQSIETGRFGSLVERGRAWLGRFAAHVRGDPADPLVPKSVLRQDRETIAAAQAVASAVRHLSQREAAFERTALYKAALDFGLPATIADIERRTRALVRSGDLIAGKGDHRGWLASRDAVLTEQRIVSEVAAGKGASSSAVEPGSATDRVQTAAMAGQGFRLNAGQLGAAKLILTSEDRTIAVQGIAGAGKSSVLKPVAEVLRSEGHPVMGLAIQNTLVQMLERDTGMGSQTLARFLGGWNKLLKDPGNAALRLEAKAALKDHVLVLDEASMVSNEEKEKLVRLANLAGVHRLVLMGDRKQLGAVDAGKPFALLQRTGMARAEMATNLRARDPVIREAQAAAQTGDVRKALRHLKQHIIEAKGDGALVASEAWLALDKETRARTSIYASGRAIRSAANAAVQQGLLANGEIGPGKAELGVLDRVNTTREELRHLSVYRPGRVLEVSRKQQALGLSAGEYRVLGQDGKGRQVEVADKRGKRFRFDPARIRAGKGDQNLTLHEPRKLEIHEGDRIRWTRNDHRRGLFNADQARVVAIVGGKVTFETSKGDQVELKKDDPMLKRIDLAYALNAHMAQGLTSDRGIAVMDSRERNLSNQKTFLVTITRLRDHLTLVVDSSDKLGAAVARNKGEKASALEVTARLAATKRKNGELDAPKPEEANKAEKELARSKSKTLDFGI
ncbi:MobF family relaxase [Aurantiacibacter poecillastricola]|uniref:MobF family relaxase n=1 Tax=Aurantiacibacter poecillastricola TaxID=3064385 RepID=UPI00273DBF56|nr:MobF family relaxase [Aurantiacibacter sp. 219JJ12-13]MDP5262346.1 MobF family relaxase [Aurantiacibacter sp. 219JJ12-13]